MEWRSILADIGVPFRQELSLRQYLSTAKQRLEWQVNKAKKRRVIMTNMASATRSGTGCYVSGVVLYITTTLPSVWSNRLWGSLLTTCASRTQWCSRGSVTGSRSSSTPLAKRLGSSSTSTRYVLEQRLYHSSRVETYYGRGCTCIHHHSKHFIVFSVAWSRVCIGCCSGIALRG